MPRLGTDILVHPLSRATEMRPRLDSVFLTANCVCQAVCRVWAGSVNLDGLWLPTIGKEYSG